MLYFVFYLLI